jgi:protein TonB
MPKFPGGKNALEKYLEISLKESNLSTNYKDESIVYVSFVILKSGKLVDIKLANMEKKQRISQKTEEKIIKIIESMPKWEPGILNGKVVNAQYFIPIKTNK